MTPPYEAHTAIHALMRGETLPREWMAELAMTTEIDLSYSRYTDLAPLAGLTALQTLGLDRCQATDLAPLAGLTATIYR